MNQRQAQRGLRQTAVVWSNPVPDGFGGVSYDAPQESICRWEDRQERFVDDNGEERLSHAIVYFPTAFGVSVANVVVLGGLSSLGGETSPSAIKLARRVQKVETVPDIKGNSWITKVWL